MVSKPWKYGAGRVKKGLNQAETVEDTQAYPLIAPPSRFPANGSDV